MFDKRPCWAEEEEYAHLKTEANLHVWAWEFLRRDSLYHSDYADFCSRSPKEKERRYYDPPRKKDETEQAWKHRCGVELDVPFKIFNLGRYMARRWMLEDMYDPNLDYGEGVRFCTVNEGVPKIVETLSDCEPFFDHVEDYGENGVGFEYEKINENFMVVVYDLTRGYGPQQDIAKTVFE
ncbi:MAG: hypothetical protein R3E13_05770 [Alphaproteobacteria bacterium]